jgi:DNA-binding SARP family transcriptional activator/WD40 repeat protein
VLFTDIVGSTDWRVRVGEEVFDHIRAAVERINRVLGIAGGIVVKSTGDGVMVGFASTASALQGAVALQRSVDERNRHADDPLSLRIGISVGDAIAEDGDLNGTAVVEAARLCDAAQGGTILCSAAVITVAGSRAGCSFGTGRSVTLKGLPEMIVHEVLWDAQADTPAAPVAPSGVTFRVLGTLEVDGPNGAIAVGGPKERAVLALLLARANVSVSVDALVDSIWAGDPPRTAERTLRAYVARLRRALEPERASGAPNTLLVTDRGGYRLSIDDDQLDARRFESLVRRGIDRHRDGQADAAASTLRSALALWRGEPYGEFPDAEPCAAEARRLTDLYRSAIEARVDADLAAGRSGELVPELEGLVREQPFHERLWGQLIIALYRSGRQRDALDAYQRARTVLADELGIEPGPELRQLEAAVLAQDPSLDRTKPLARRTSGFPLALEAIGPAFVGRERELDWLRSAWARAVSGDGGFVSVLGPEGMGKTRLVAELAREAYGSGGAVLYGRCDHAFGGAHSLLDQALASGGAALADSEEGDRRGDLAESVTRYLPLWSEGRPVLLILDDLHVADAETLEIVADVAGWCRATSMLVVGAFESDGTDGAGDDRAQLVLGPLAGDAVGEICALYGTEGWIAEDVRHLAQVTGGVPLLVHEQASAWARERASRRIEDATTRLSASRGRLLTTRTEVADGVEGIRRLLEQRRSQLAGREAQHQANAIAALGGCPYKGLARFEAADAANFFGRERLVAELVARIAEAGLLAVVGPSGSGKSSLVRAGLLPALASGLLPGSEPWQTITLCPGDRPLDELEARLRAAGARGQAPLVVFVDQFEETFNLDVSAQERREFVDRLIALSRGPGCAIVLAVRADHLARCLSLTALAEALTGYDVLVGPMRDSELKRAVELPAQRAGLAIEPGLVDVIVADVAGRAGALPLLSTALAETWERRTDRTLTLAGYRAAGGVNGAVARLAEDAYATLSPESATAAKRILLRLCDTGEAGLDLRRRMPIDDVVDPDDIAGRAALEAMSDRRLVILDAGSAEVAHEALLREWPRLRTWLEEDVQGRQMHRRLGDAARAWEAMGRDPSELYRGTRLGAAADWATQHDSALNRAERAFLDASLEEAARELDEAEQRAAEEVSTNRRLRRLLSGIAVALVLALLGGTVAIVQSHRAARERDRAQNASAEAEARTDDVTLHNLRSEADLIRGTRRDLAALLAVAAYRVDPSPQSLNALLGTFTATPSFVSTTPIDAGDTSIGVLMADQKTLAMADARMGITLVDVATGSTKRTLPPIEGPNAYGRLAASPDGRHLAVGGQAKAGARLVVWDTSTGGRRVDVRLGVGVGDIDYSPDGSLIAVSGGEAGTTEIRSATDGRLVQTVAALPRPATAVYHENTAAIVFLPNGTLAIASQAGPLRVVDPRTGAELSRLAGPVEAASAILTRSADGRRVVGLSEQGAAAWDLTTGRLLWSTRTSPDCGDLVVADEAGVLLCPLADGGVTAIDMETGTRADAPFVHQHGPPAVVAVTPDGTGLIEASGSAITRWRLDGGGAVEHVVPRTAGWQHPAFDDRGRLVLSRPSNDPSSPQGTDLEVVDADTGAVVDPLDGIVAAVPSSGDPDVLGVVYPDGSSGLYDVVHHAPVRVKVAAGDDRPRGLRFQPIGAIRTKDRLVVWSDDRIQGITYDGRLVAPSARVPAGIVIVTASFDGTRLFTRESTGRLVQRDPSGKPTGRAVPGVTDAATNAEVVVVATTNGQMRVLDARTLEPVGREFPGSRSNVSFNLAPDGKRLLVSDPPQGPIQLADVPSRTFLGDPIDPNADGGGRIGTTVDTDGVVSSDGQRLAYPTPKGVVVWDLHPRTLVEAACRVAGRDLTRSEWNEYVAPLAPFEKLCS